MCLSPVLFSCHLKDIEEQFMSSGLKGLDNFMLKVFILLYADSIVSFADTAEEVHNSLDVLLGYCASIVSRVQMYASGAE